MSRITDLVVLQRFTSNIDHKVYGFYWCKFNGTKKLIVQNGDSWGAVSHWMGEPVTKCINVIRQDVIDELLTLLDGE